jgi:serine/threonine protein kinase
LKAQPLRCYDYWLFVRSPQLHTDAAGFAPPDAFGSFRVLHQIGAGTLGPVFRAYDPEGERLVAVKLIRLDLPPERVHRLVAELEGLIAALPIHPAIVTPLAAGIDGVTAYLAQEYVAADSLDLLLRQQKQASVRDSLRVAAQLAGALETAAVAGIHHGALHPRDILVTADDTKLTGLGLAQVLETIGIAPPLRRPYTAPEQVGHPAWTRQADVFGLAAIVYEMLSGRRVPGTGSDAAAALTDALGGDLERLRDVFRRALAEDPKTRFDSPLDFAEALTYAFSTGLLAAVAEPPPDESALVRELARAESRLPLEPSTVDGRARPLTPESPVEPPALVVEPQPQPRIDEPRLPIVESQETPEPLLAGTRPQTVELKGGPITLDEITPRARRPATSVDFTELTQAPPGALESDRSRSALSPLAFALVIGIALGFAAGFGVGLRRASAPADTPALTGAEGAAATTGAAGQSEAPKPAPPAAAQPEPTQPASPPTEAPVVGSLLVRSTPPGARVFVDGREYGLTPVTVGNLARGVHRVRVVRNGYAADEQQLTITPAQRTHSVTVRLSPERPPTPIGEPPPSPSASSLARTGVLTVESRPAGARVFVDGAFVGTTPLVLPDVAAGDHAVHLELDGYRRWASSVRVIPSESNRITASMDR